MRHAIEPDVSGKKIIFSLEKPLKIVIKSKDASATHLSLFGKSVNTDGIDIDGVKNVTAPVGSIRLRGYDADHKIENVLFRNCRIGGEPVDGPEDITTNEFVSRVKFEITD